MPDDALPGPKRDGRRTHIVDRALEYVALAERGLSAARIAKAKRKSQGYVSIALRLGRAIAGMEPAELEALRSPRVTWKLAQRIVRDGVDAVSVRHQLRSAVGGFSSHNQDGRRRRRSRALGRPGNEEPGRAIGVAWGWDAAWFARDPIGFVDAHLRYLGGAHQSIHARAARAMAARTVERMPVGQGIRTLQRSVAAAHARAATGTVDGATDAPTADARRALALLELLDRKLTEVRAEAATIVGRTSGRTPSTPTLAIDPDDDSLASSVESDLRD